MKIKMILAVSTDGYIGTEDGQLPWKQREDLKHFMKKTTGHPVILGRKTLDSFPKLLPNREHFVLSKSILNLADSMVKFKDDPNKGSVHHLAGFHPSLLQPLIEEQCGTDIDVDTVWIIGGEEVFREALKVLNVSEIQLTIIHADYPHATSDWAKMEISGFSPYEAKTITGKADTENEFDYTIYTCYPNT